MQLYRYKVLGEITEYEYDEVIEKWTAKEVIFAQDGWEAMEIFEQKLRDECPFYGDIDGYDFEIDDTRYELLGPADLFLSVRRSSYSPDMNTLTVEELIELLKRDFDPKAKLYLADYSGMTAQYSGIEWDSITSEGEDKYEY